jgi:hypothetical protein
MSYIGIPPFGNTVRSVTNVVATASQTTFNIIGGYVIGYVDVFLNGVLLKNATDYTATDGLTVVLTSGASASDEFQAISYQPISLAQDTMPTGGQGNPVFYENDPSVTQDYTLTTSKNAMSTGTITINSGITVTIPSGQRWVII